MKPRVLEFLNKTISLHPNQFVFRHGLSTELALVAYVLFHLLILDVILIWLIVIYCYSNCMRCVLEVLHTIGLNPMYLISHTESELVELTVLRGNQHVEFHRGQL